MVRQNIFRGGKRAFGGETYIKYNEINNNSENFRGARLLLRGESCGPVCF